MIVRSATLLAAPANKVWQTLLKQDTFLHITRGMLGFTGTAHWPATFDQGADTKTRLVFFHILPAWSHTMKLVEVDSERYVLRSEELGGPIRRWDHHILIGSVEANRCLYTDKIDIDAGWLTIAVWAWANLFYRYRQMRWRKLASTLS
jgi:hypothetical protein